MKLLKQSIVLIPIVILILALKLDAYNLTFPLSPGETNGTVYSYHGVWCYTNMLNSNQWFFFNSCPAGNTSMLINASVPSPAYLTVQVVGTNYLLSTPNPTNAVLYATNVLATIYTNQVPPVNPSTNTISQ